MRENHLLSGWLRQPVVKLLKWPGSPAALRLLGGWVYLGRKADSDPQSRMPLSEVQRVLVIRLDEIGDVVLTTPLLRELRRNLPRAWITLVVKKTVYNLVANCPYVNEVLTFDWQAPLWRLYYTHLWRAWRLARRHLRPRRFDLALVPRWGYGDYYFAKPLAYLSGARGRIGFSEQCSNPDLLESAGDRLLTQALHHREPRHEVRRSLDLLEYLGGTVQDDSLDLWLTSQEREEARQRLTRQGLGPGDLLISLGPGASRIERQWPLSQFAELGSWIIRTYGARLLVVSGPGDEPLGQTLAQTLGDGVINLAGKTTLRQTTALISQSQLYVGNDSGPMHLAAAVGVPVVEISSFPGPGQPLHPRSPARFGPWGVPHRILQPAGPVPPCTKVCLATEPHCILGVTVALAQEAAAELLAATRKNPRVDREAGVTA
jgi:ADP-heptose:LPS heptosyltransferase